MYEVFHPKYVNAFTCSNAVFSVTVLLPIGSCPLNYIILGFNGDILLAASYIQSDVVIIYS
jgi:hypothetical protein